jgi:putative transposase
MSQDRNHLNRATWECKYHIAFTPQYRKKVLFGQIRRHLGTVFRELAQRSGLRRMWNAGCAILATNSGRGATLFRPLAGTRR